jgi:hypothetical protein
MPASAARTGVSVTITTATPSGGVDTYTLTTDGFGARLMRFDQVVQVFDSTLATFRGKGVITQWDVENKTIQVTPSITGATTGDLLVTDGITSPKSLACFIWYSLSSLECVPRERGFGFDRSITPEIRANRVNAGNNPLTLPLPRLAINKVGNRVGIDNNFKMTAWTHPAQPGL